MNTRNLVLAALKEKAPKLLRELTQSGKLQEFLTKQAEEIDDQIATLTMQIASKRGYSKEKSLPEAAGALKAAERSAAEIVHHEMLDFPQDGTSPQSQGETSDSEMTT